MPTDTCQEHTFAPVAAAADGEATFSIGELAQAFRVSVRTLRFYEDRGLLRPGRSGVTRRYDRSDRDRIAFILRTKRLGFTLREIGEMLPAIDDDCGSLNLTRRQCTEQINLLERQKRAIEEALRELRRAYSDHYVRSLEAGDSRIG